MLKLLIATRNKGKIKEFKELLQMLPIELQTLDDFVNVREVAETGITFAENAKLKAESYALQTNCWTIADDSGLEVEALDNAPGIYSARYAGENANDKENLNKLLSELEQTGDQNRRAKFVCVIAVSDSQGSILYTAKGICEGTISQTPAGKNGFGYDPVFIPDKFENTFAELPVSVKQKISHRAKALEQIIVFFNENTAF